MRRLNSQEAFRRRMTATALEGSGAMAVAAMNRASSTGAHRPSLDVTGSVSKPAPNRMMAAMDRKRPDQKKIVCLLSLLIILPVLYGFERLGSVC
jgi:hypothetical protein